MKVYLNDGEVAEIDLSPDELYALFLATKKGAKVFIRILPRNEGESRGKVYRNIAFIDCHRTLEEIMVGFDPDPDDPIPCSVVPDTERP